MVTRFAQVVKPHSEYIVTQTLTAVEHLKIGRVAVGL